MAFFIGLLIILIHMGRSKKIDLMRWHMLGPQTCMLCCCLGLWCNE